MSRREEYILLDMNTSKDVEAWFGKCQNPLKQEMLRVRELILSADERMTECIKWQTPTFCFEGNLASFNPKSKQHVSLLFHSGAQIPGKHPKLQGGGDTGRYMQLVDMAEVEAAKKDLAAVVKAWCALKSERPPAKTKPAKAKKKRA
jgi:hypothetical protein